MEEMEENVKVKAATIIEAMSIYISAMKELDRQYAKAKADIEEMFQARIRGIANANRANTPVS